VLEVAVLLDRLRVRRTAAQPLRSLQQATRPFHQRDQRAFFKRIFAPRRQLLTIIGMAPD
jgi:hypothetical protein